MSNLSISASFSGPASQILLEKLSQMLLEHEEMILSIGVEGQIDAPVLTLNVYDPQMHLFDMWRKEARQKP